MRKMNLLGSWKNRVTGEIIEISDTKEKGVYSLEYVDQEGNFSYQKIWVKIKSDKKAKITYSLKFGKCKIITQSAECIKIGKELFDYIEPVPDRYKLFMEGEKPKPPGWPFFTKLNSE